MVNLMCCLKRMPGKPKSDAKRSSLLSGSKRTLTNVRLSLEVEMEMIG